MRASRAAAAASTSRREWVPSVRGAGRGAREARAVRGADQRARGRRAGAGRRRARRERAPRRALLLHAAGGRRTAHAGPRRAALGDASAAAPGRARPRRRWRLAAPRGARAWRAPTARRRAIEAARGPARARADAGLGGRTLRAAARAARGGGDQDRGAPPARHLARRLRDADPRRAAGPPDGAPRLELPPLLQLRQPQPARRHARPAEARGHPALPAAAALDRHRRRELHAARPRQPRDLLRGDARAAAGRDPLLDQRLRRERPLPRSPLQRRHDRARLRHVVAARLPRRAASQLGRDLPRPARRDDRDDRDPRGARTPRPHRRGPAHRHLDAGGDACAGRRRGAGAGADRAHAGPAGQPATRTSRLTASTPRAARTAGSPSPPRTTRSGRSSAASPHAPSG